MNQEIALRLDAILRSVESGDFINEARSSLEWGGSDVIVSSNLSNDIRKWLDDCPLVISFQNTEPRRRVVITQYSKELSWLFFQLRDAFAGCIDYISKYDFYGQIAQSAIDYLEANKEHADCTQLLKAVLAVAKTMIKE